MNAHAVKPDRLTEAQRLGMALRSLRRRASDLSQAKAAANMGVGQQAWQKWEAGENDALLKSSLQRRAVAALGADWEEWQMEIARFDGILAAKSKTMGMAEAPPRSAFHFPIQGLARPTPQGFEVYGDLEPDIIDLSSLLGPDTRVLRQASEEMIPYAAPGGFVTYNLRRFPRQGQGCVIEMKTGRFHVKRYERTVGDTLYVTELHPKERQLTFDMNDVAGVYAVGLRGD